MKKKHQQDLALIVIWSTCLCIFWGCASTSIRQKSGQAGETVKTDPREAGEAVGSIAEALTGKELSPEEQQRLLKDIQKDEEAQSAIQTISDSLNSQSIRVKYSPATGKRYSADLEYCPETGVKLLPVE